MVKIRILLLQNMLDDVSGKHSCAELNHRAQARLPSF